MKFFFLIILIVSLFGCNFLKCENVKENNLSGVYRNKRIPNNMITINQNKYQYHSPTVNFSGEIRLTNKNNCEITFDNWKNFNDSDSTCINACAKTIIVNKNQLIFDIDNYNNNFYKK